MRERVRVRHAGQDRDLGRDGDLQAAGGAHQRLSGGQVAGAERHLWSGKIRDGDAGAELDERSQPRAPPGEAAGGDEAGLRQDAVAE